MAKFEVTLRREYVEEAKIVVEAPTTVAAGAMALDAVRQAYSQVVFYERAPRLVVDRVELA